jgi:hypothetical protein
MRVLAGALTLSAVIALGIAAFEAIPTASHGPAAGVVWRGQTFATRAAFARWLRSRGVSYRAWARQHPVQAGLTRPEGQKHSGWRPGGLVRIAAFLGALALGVSLVRRRWPGSGAYAARLIKVIGITAAAALEAGARTAWHRAAPMAQRSMARATAAASGARYATSRAAANRLDVVAHSGAGTAEAGARATRRWAALTARRTMALTTAAASSARHGTGGSAARGLEVVALRGAEAAEAGARTTRRWAALTAQRLMARATAAAFRARPRRSELVWYVTMALLAAGIGVVLTVSLNGA